MIKIPPIIPEIVDPAYIAALPREDMVLLSFIGVLCIKVMNIGKTKPLSIMISVKIAVPQRLDFENGILR